MHCNKRMNINYKTKKTKHNTEIMLNVINLILKH